MPARERAWPASRTILVYLAIVFFTSWPLAITFAVLGGRWGSAASQAVALLFTVPPAFAALIIKGAIQNAPVVDQLGLSLRLSRWWLVAWLVPPLVWVLAVALSGLLPGVSHALSIDDFVAYYRPLLPDEELPRFEREVRSYGMHPALGMLLQAMVAGITINAVRGLGEEIGWRGLLHRELPLDRVRKALVIGAIWGVFYAPLVALGFRYPGEPVLGIALHLVFCLLVSGIASILRDRSGSIFPVAILWGSFEAVSKLPPLVRGGGPLTTGVFGVAGLVAIALVLAVLVALERRRPPAA